MKCLLKTTEAAGFELTDIDIPKPSSGELLVKVIKVGLCGSDIQLYKWSESKVLSSVWMQVVLANVPIEYPLKALENCWFQGV